jgi:ribulose-5-phosphate 4-epimerase/fuculose-1-phosphate aldolase
MPLGRLAIRSMRDQVSPEEWEARVNLAACYRLVAHYGMVDMIANHISVRVPGHHDQFLINPYGVFYEEMTASSLMKINLEGEVLAKNPDLDYSFNRAGFVIHGAIHRARRDLDCVIHTHTAMGMAVASMKCGLLPMTQTAMRFAKVGYHDYESVAIDMAEQERLVRDLGDADVMILRNHGLIACGPSIAEAFSNIWRLELACTAQVHAMSSGVELIKVPDDVVQRTSHLYHRNTRRPWGVLEWPGLLRMLDRRDSSYRE